MNKREIILNSVYLKNRVAELGIKQWWLAEQIGVDRKTVVRWIQGQVKSIQIENAKALADVLNCKIEDLSAENSADLFATVEDQKTAANLMISSRLFEKLGPIGEWDVIESLLKATIVPNLPLSVLGEIYNRLTVASWRQSKIDQADLYNKKAEAIARKTNDKSLLAGALLSKANIYSWRGKTKNSIDSYKECIELAKFIEPKVLGSTLSNLSAVLYEVGEWGQGEIHQRRAIEIFEVHGLPMNLSIAHGHLARIHLHEDRVVQAKEACESSIQFATQDEYLRGLHMGALIMAEISAREGDVAKTRELIGKGLGGFEAIKIREGLNFEFAGRASRWIGDIKSSVEYLEEGLSISTEFPIELAALNFEMAKTLAAKGCDEDSVLSFARQAVLLFQQCEADRRVEEVRNQFGASRLD